MQALPAIRAFCIVFVFFILASTLTAQRTDDPFDGHYTIAKSAEAYLLEIVNNDEASLQAFDFDRKNYTINRWDKQTTPLPTDFHWSCVDVVSADLNGDSRDEIVWVLSNSAQKAYIQVNSVINRRIQPGIRILAPFDCITDKEMATTRLITGNFVPDAKEELALAYMGTDGKFHVKIYQAVGSNMQLVKLAENSSIGVAGKVWHNAEYDFTGDHFDITAIDYDQDGTDEIVMVHKLDIDFSPRHFYFRTVSFDVTGENDVLSTTVSDLGPIELDYGNAQGHYAHRIGRISRPSLACGDLDGDGRDEIVFGHIVSTRHDYFPFMAHKSEIFTVHMLGTSSNGNVSFFNGPNLKLVGSFVSSGHAQNWHRHRSSMTVACADINNDGKDDIVSSSPDSLHMFSYNGFSGQLEDKTGVDCNDQRVYDHRQPSFAIADVNVDTSASEWTKEIVYMRYSPGRGDISLGIAALENGRLKEKASYPIQPESYAKTNELRYALALGDFDRDGYRLGPPELVATIPDVREPRVIINAPPVHFDIIDGMEYDLGSAFDGDSEFISSYTHSEGTTNELLIKNVADWDYSFGGSYEINLFVASANTAFTGKHGQYFEDSDFDTESIVEVTSIDASKNDWYYTTITDYHLFEYPLVFDSGEIGNVLVQYPEFKGDEWTHGKSQDARHIIPNHEAGNILSYAGFTDMRDRDTLSIEGTRYTLSDEYPADGGYWQLDLSNTTQTSFLKKTYNNNSWELNINLLDQAEFFGLEIGGGVNFQSSGRYDSEKIISSAITAGTGTNVEVNLGKLDKQSFGEVDYKITPYVYYSENGAFILDYIAEPIAIANGTAVDTTWWDRHYSSHPDLAFIQPWRYDVEKGFLPNITDAKRTQTKDLIFAPRHPEPGDTLSILTRFHNYSLKDLNENISIQYFLGDPDNGGELMNVLYEGLETSEIVLAADLPEREEMVSKVDWVIPANIDYQPRIYAVLDPDNAITEIHENNNKGNAVLEIRGVVTAIDDYENVIPTDYALEQNYPNPFNPSTRIRFTVPTAGMVKIDIFNTLGQKVETLVDKRMAGGVHEVKFTAENLASGPYFYQITAGDFVDVRKMMLLR